MARIAIELPERFAYSTQITLLSTHMNMTGHLDNALLLTLLSETRIRFWQSLGYADATNLNGVTGVVSDAAVVYKAQAYHGQTLRIDMALSDFAKYGFDFVWRITELSSGHEVARGKTGILCVDRETHKVTPFPERLLEQLKAL